MSRDNIGVWRARLAELAWQAMMGFLALALIAALWLMKAPLLEVVDVWYGRVGIAIYGLLPLTVFLIYVVVHILVSPARREPWIEKSLKVVSIAGPLLGMLGTVLGVASGASQTDLAQGTEHLLAVATGLMQALSEVLLSTAWGIVLALPALVIQTVMFDGKQDED